MDWKSSLNLDEFSKELKTNCTWLKLLMAELFVLYGQRKEQFGTKAFLKFRMDKKAKKKYP